MDSGQIEGSRTCLQTFRYKCLQRWVFKASSNVVYNVNTLFHEVNCITVMPLSVTHLEEKGVMFFFYKTSCFIIALSVSAMSHTAKLKTSNPMRYLLQLYSLLWWRRQNEPVKHQSTSTTLRGAISQKAVIFIHAAVRTWNLTCCTCDKLGNMAKNCGISMVNILHIVTDPLLEITYSLRWAPNFFVGRVLRVRE
jgi:hypothetical protein